MLLSSFFEKKINAENARVRHHCDKMKNKASHFKQDQFNSHSV